MKISDILNDIEFKGNKTSIILKWVISLSITGIIFAFVLGSRKTDSINKLNQIEKLAKESIENTKSLEEKVDNRFDEIDIKIQKVYDDGIKSFNEYSEFNKKQMNAIIDYGDENKEMLKDLLDMNYDMINNKIEKDLLIKSDPQIKKSVINDKSSNKKIYLIYNAPESYLDTLNLNEYIIMKKERNDRYVNLFDFIYKERK